MISIIVPVYKVEQYLAQCIRSILRQTYNDFELILIDDGSPDRCGDICDQWAKKDSRIRVSHQPNSGVSSARNAGIELARGNWITFIDSDDLVTPNYLSSFGIERLSSVDIAIQGTKCFSSRKLLFKTEFEDCISETAFCLTKKITDYSGPWGKLFRTKLIKDHHIKFPIGISYGEDTIFYYQYLLHTNNIQLSHSSRYLYRGDRSDSATKIAQNPLMLWDSYEGRSKLLQELYAKHAVKCPYPDEGDLGWLKSLILGTFSNGLYRPLYQKLIHKVKRSDSFQELYKKEKRFRSILFFLFLNLPIRLQIVILNIYSSAYGRNKGL